MRKLIFILLLSPFLSYSQASICAQHVCVDTVYQPVNQIHLLARVLSSSDPIVSRGWSFISGPATVIPQPGVDSSLITLTVPGVYIFSYTVTNSKGALYSGKDQVSVIPLTVKSTLINYVDGTSAQSKEIKNIIITYTNGTIKTVTP